MTALLGALGRGRNVRRHVRADREQLAEHAGMRPLGDRRERRAVAEHVAHLDLQAALDGLVQHARERLEVVAGGLVVPDVLAGRDRGFGHGQTQVIARLDRDRDHARIRECFGGALGLPDADRVDFRVRCRAPAISPAACPWSVPICAMRSLPRSVRQLHRPASSTRLIHALDDSHHAPPIDPVTAGGRLSRSAPMMSRS